MENDNILVTSSSNFTEIIKDIDEIDSIYYNDISVCLNFVAGGNLKEGRFTKYRSGKICVYFCKNFLLGINCIENSHYLKKEIEILNRYKQIKSCKFNDESIRIDNQFIDTFIKKNNDRSVYHLINNLANLNVSNFCKELSNANEDTLILMNRFIDNLKNKNVQQLIHESYVKKISKKKKSNEKGNSL